MNENGFFLKSHIGNRKDVKSRIELVMLVNS